MTLRALNAMDRDAFVASIGWVFELNVDELRLGHTSWGSTCAR